MITIQEHVDLLPYNTFKLSCIARYLVVVRSVQDVQELIQYPLRQSIDRKLFLGGGSNILFMSPTYDGLVVKNEIQGIGVQSEEGRVKSEQGTVNNKQGLSLGPCGRAVASQHTSTSSVGHCYQSELITLGGGENRDDLVRWSIKQGYAGLENLVSIPGTVGASPVQNIGAYGLEVSDLIYEVHGVDMQTGQKRVYTHDACQFAYRSSIFKTTLREAFLITHVVFRLKKYDSQTYIPLLKYGADQERVSQLANSDLITPEIVATAIAEIRSEKLPDWHQIGTAGSFFKNPYVSEKKFLELQEKFGIKGWKIEENSENNKQNTEYRMQNIEHNEDTNSQDLRLKTYNVYYKLSAGQLIDLAGLKGYRQGKIGVYDQHALVLVNYGETDGRKFGDLIQMIQEKVYEMFGVELTNEVNILGEI